MMTEKDIFELINKDYQQFYNRRFDYPRGLPFGFVSKFRMMVLHIPYLNHEGKPAWRCSPEVARKIIDKQDEDLSFVDVGIIVNLLLATPQALHFDDPAEAIEYIMELLDLKDFYNQKVDRMNKEMEERQARLLKISGHTNATNFNGTKN